MYVAVGHAENGVEYSHTRLPKCVLVEDGDSSDPADSRVSQELDVALNRMRSGESLMKCRSV